MLMTINLYVVILMIMVVGIFGVKHKILLYNL
jgi:hypothetical protein